MTSAEVRCSDGTMVEVRLDAGRAPYFGAAARSTGGFDALRDTQHVIYRCSRHPEGAILPSQRTESGECRIIRLRGGATFFDATMSDAALHAVQGIITNVTSTTTINVDGTETTGTVTGNTTAGKAQFSGAASTVVNIGEHGFIDNVAWATGSSGVAGKLCHNQVSFYGLTPGTNCNP